MDPSNEGYLVSSDGHSYPIDEVLHGYIEIPASIVTPAQRVSEVRDRVDTLQIVADIIGVSPLNAELNRALGWAISKAGGALGVDEHLRGKRLAMYWTPVDAEGHRTVDCLLFVRGAGIWHQHIEVRVPEHADDEADYLVQKYEVFPDLNDAELLRLLSLPVIGPNLTARVLVGFDDIMEAAIKVRETNIQQLRFAHTRARRSAARTIREVAAA